METKTTWEDTGRDCQFCGGEIFRRTDEEPRRITAYYQCQRCGAQWSLGHELIRESSVTTTPEKDSVQAWFAKVPRWVWVLVAVLLVIGALRFSVIGVVLMRVLIPAVFVGIVAGVIYMYGRWMDWW